MSIQNVKTTKQVAKKRAIGKLNRTLSPMDKLKFLFRIRSQTHFCRDGGVLMGEERASPASLMYAKIARETLGHLWKHGMQVEKWSRENRINKTPSNPRRRVAVTMNTLKWERGWGD